MKNTIIYSVIFLLVFGIVTGAIFFLNTKYKNIFAFDFTPETHQQTAIKKDEAKVNPDSLKIDSMAVKSDSLVAVNDSSEVKKDSTLQKVAVTQKDSNTKPELVKQEKPKKVEPVAPKQVATEIPMLPKTNLKQTASKDSVYHKWLSETVKLYEVMDSKKVAKVLLSYSDNIARDLILRMRKKKAAEILSEFKPEVVSRLISVN